MVHLSASDLVGHLNCHYLTKFDLAVTKGKLDKPSVWDPVLELLVERGALHEQSYLDHLEASGLSILRIDGIGVDTHAVAQTLDAMRAGAPIIAQGALQAGRWGGATAKSPAEIAELAVPFKVPARELPMGDAHQEFSTTLKLRVARAHEAAKQHEKANCIAVFIGCPL